jgi:hypothetical protein
MPAAPEYDERLRVPVRWWLLTAAFLVSMLAAFLVATPLWVARAGTAVLTLAVAGVLVGYGAARLSVRDGRLHAGRARISASYVGEVEVLDAAAAHRLAGRDADARAYLLLRPYVHTAVRVQIADAADPTPYWLLATRQPDRLAASHAAARDAAARDAAARDAATRDTATRDAGAPTAPGRTSRHHG